jgi:ubiquinone/menaquinone biosynthesis C-methylase UbiE
MALAPRKKLWSTPQEVLREVGHLLALGPSDVCFDIGAGDGRFILHCGAETSVGRVVGVEIDEERGQQARTAIAQQGLESRVEMIIGNALEQDYTQGTAFFLYLVPRGLRIMLPLLKSLPRKIRVVTYMAPFPPDLASPLRAVKVSTEQHPEARWPLYYYELNTEGSREGGNASCFSTS